MTARVLRGMDPDTSALVADHLVIACDQLSEALTWIREQDGDLGTGVEEGLLTLYRLRNELGLLGGDVVADLAKRSETEAAE